MLFILLSNLYKSEFIGQSHIPGGSPDANLSTVLRSLDIPGRTETEEGIADILKFDGLDRIFVFELLKISILLSPT